MRNFFQKFVHYITYNHLSGWLILGMDIILSMLCSVIAFLSIFYITGHPFKGMGLLSLLITSFIGTYLGALLFKTHKNIIRYSQAIDFWRIFCSVGVKLVVMCIAVFFIFNKNILYNSQSLVFIIFDSLLTVVAFIVVRIIMILVYESLLKMNRKAGINVLIYGSDAKSLALKTTFTHSVQYKIIGFCITGESRDSYRLAELPVYEIRDEKDYYKLINKKKVQGIIFADSEDIKKEEKRLILYCSKSDVKLFISPDIRETDKNEAQIRTVRPIKIEDLLGRQEICVNIEKIVREFEGKTVLVTGAAGSIGSELCRQLALCNIQRLVMFDSAETPLHNLQLEMRKTYPQLDFVTVIGDIRVKERLKAIFECYKPQIVLHAAAYKHVPLMEDNPCEAVLVNVVGTRYVSEVAVQCQVEKLIMISTDKAVNPTNVMGASKRLAEVYVQSLGCAISEGKVQGKTKFITTRFGNVLGSNGSVIPLFRQQIESGGPLTVTHPEVIRYFMTIPEACKLVLEASSLGNGNEIFVFDMGDMVKIVDLARRMITLAGYQPDKDIKIEYTGLRPGEKLYEELLSIDENTIPIEHQKIRIAKVRHYSYHDIIDDYDRLEHLSRIVQIVPTVSLMKKMIPEFVSQNSKYESLDHLSKEK